MAAETALLDLVTPTQGTLTGSWGNTVNNGITEYVDIAIAGTLELNGDGAVTLANTIGDASATNIGSTTAQYAILKITGTLTATKVITAPSSSKTYIVDNTTATYGVTIKASGQTGVTIVAGEKATVYFNGTDYVKVASSTTDGVSTISFGSTGLTPSTATSGAVTVAGTLAVGNGGTGVTTSTGSGNVVLSTSPTLVTPALGTPSAGTLSNCTVDGTNGVGYINLPQNAQTGSYTLVLGDAAKHVYHASGAGAATYTIPANSSVAFPIGTAITFVNMSTTSISIAITTDTMYLAKDGTTGTRTLAQYGSATALKLTSTTWLISGSALT